MAPYLFFPPSSLPSLIPPSGISLPLLHLPLNRPSPQREIRQLLNVSFAHSSGENHFDLKDSYLLLVNLDVTESQAGWNGRTISIKASAETTIAISEIQVC